MTLKPYRHFDLRFEWKLGKGGNSGVKYFIEERQPKPQQGSQAGYEYQFIDDADYIYNGKHLPDDLKTASIYDVAAARKAAEKMDVWHQSRIVVQNNHIEHWLDGLKSLTLTAIQLRFGRVAYIAYAQGMISNWGASPGLSEQELAYIQSDEPRTNVQPERISWFALLRYRQTWAFAIGKFMADPI